MAISRDDSGAAGCLGVAVLRADSEAVYRVDNTRPGPAALRHRVGPLQRPRLPRLLIIRPVLIGFLRQPLRCRRAVFAVVPAVKASEASERASPDAARDVPERNGPLSHIPRLRLRCRRRSRTNRCVHERRPTRTGSWTHHPRTAARKRCHSRRCATRRGAPLTVLTSSIHTQHTAMHRTPSSWTGSANRKQEGE